MTTYSRDSEGKFIPASQRPDGTWRKARRVRDGYIPQEEVPLYKSKGKEFAQRKSTLPPGMCPIAADAARKERERQERAKKDPTLLAAAALTAAIEAPAKAKAKAKVSKKQTAPGVVVLPAKGKNSAVAANSCPSQSVKNASAAATNTTTAAATNPNTTTTTTSTTVDALTNGIATNLKLNDEQHIDFTKQLKKLRKKIREIESIEERLKSGDLKNPEKDQLDKVKRKKEILKEINDLEQQLEQQQPTGQLNTLSTED